MSDICLIVIDVIVSLVLFALFRAFDFGRTAMFPAAACIVRFLRKREKSNRVFVYRLMR